MNGSLRKALTFLTGKSDIEAATVEELEKFVNDHPYFSVGQLLLAKKLVAENHPKHLQQVQKTALYFSNPYWLHYQLQKEISDEPSNDAMAEADHEEAMAAESKHKSIIIDKSIVTDEEQRKEQIAGDENSNNLEEIAFEKLVAISEQQPPIATEFSTAEIDADNNSLNNNTGTIVEKDNEEAEKTDKKWLEETREFGTTAGDKQLERTTAQIETKKEEAINTEATTAIPEPPDVELASQPEEEMAAITRETDETTERFLEELEKRESENGVPKQSVKDEAPEEEMSSSDRQKTLPKVEESEDYDPDETEEIADEVEEIDEHEEMFQNIKAMLDASAKEANADVRDAVLPIDPYHTIDYFASQGIKLDLKKNQPDKLGKQVKKFTQWLKHMKKVGPEDALASEGISAEEVEAQRMADASNTAREVVTEAMALVLEKQGKKDKAIQLYRKLTFLNPDKSAYFASKIKNLNAT